MISALSVNNRGEMQSNQNKYDAIIVGLGKTGLSCVRHLSRTMSNLAVADTRKEPPELNSFKSDFPKIPLYLGEFQPDLFSSTDMLVLSPGVPVSSPAIQQAIENGVQVSGDIELFLKQATSPVVAITGSNGKSTVAELISAMISDSGASVLLGGNIGTPALTLLDSPVPDFYVLELSSFQLETVTNLDSIASTVLNVSEDHMDRYKNLQEYIVSKKKIYMGDGKRIVNLDDPVVRSMVNFDAKIIAYGLDVPVDNNFGIRIYDHDSWLCFGEKKILKSSDLNIKGKHNLSNALASLALGYAIGLEFKSMAKTLKRFIGLPHRCEWIANIAGVDWINDSKGTNPGATCAAIEGLSDLENIILIAGGDGKGADFSSLKHAAKDRVHTAILIGKDAVTLENVLTDTCRILHATSMEGAVNAASKIAKNGDRVLLSPACSSLDMFTDYKERGEKFIQSVQKLKNMGGKGE